MRDKRKEIETAIGEAERFITKTRRTLFTAENTSYGVISIGKDNAAMKRSSMDLTRSLVTIRNTEYS